MIPQDDALALFKQTILRNTLMELDALFRIRSALTTLAALCNATHGEATTYTYGTQKTILQSTIAAYLAMPATAPDGNARAAVSALVRESKGLAIVSRKHAPDRIALCLQAVDYLRARLMHDDTKP